MELLHGAICYEIDSVTIFFKTDRDYPGSTRCVKVEIDCDAPEEAIEEAKKELLYYLDDLDANHMGWETDVVMRIADETGINADKFFVEYV